MSVLKSNNIKRVVESQSEGKERAGLPDKNERGVFSFFLLLSDTSALLHSALLGSAGQLPENNEEQEQQRGEKDRRIASQTQIKIRKEMLMSAWMITVSSESQRPLSGTSVLVPETILVISELINLTLILTLTLHTACLTSLG